MSRTTGFHSPKSIDLGLIKKGDYSRFNQVKAPKKGTGNLLEVRDFSAGLKEAGHLESHLYMEINMV